MRTHTYPPFVRQTLIAWSLAIGALGIHAAPADAAVDLLKLPARTSPLAPKSLMLAIANTGERLVAAGERGIIIYSDDAGATWTQASVPVSVTLTTLYFTSKDIGWAAGHDGVILQTTDSGKTWQRQFDGTVAAKLVLEDLQARVKLAEEAVQKADAKSRDAAQATLDSLQATLDDAMAGAEFGPSRPILGLWFRNASEGIAVGAFGQMFHTADGGKSWESWGGRIANPDGFHYNAIAVIADGSLVVSGEAGKLRRSRDGGASWETIDTGYAGHLYGTLAIPGTPVLLTYGFAGNVLRSEDGGKSWKLLPKLTNKAIIGGTVLSDGRVVLLASDRSQLVSINHGNSFTTSKPASARPVAAAVTAPKNHNAFVAAGAGGVSVLNIESTKP